MTVYKTAKLFIVFLAAILMLASCRREEEPTEIPVPTSPAVTAAIKPTEKVSQAPTPEPTAERVYDWSPQLVQSSPGKGEKARLDGTIAIRFDQPMDVSSVNQAFAFNAFDSGEDISGTIDWPRPDTLVFTPEEQLKRDQFYQVKIGDSAKGQSGIALRAPITLQMQTVGQLEVVQTVPAGGTNDVDTDSAITVVFNRPVVPLVASGEQDNLPDPLTFLPEINGEGEWISTSIYRFQPEQSLAGSTKYSAIVKAGLEDVTGGELIDDFVWWFETIGPKVVSTSPADGEVEVVPTKPVTVTFNMPMNHGSTQSAIVTDPQTALSFSWSDDSRSVSLLPQNGFELARQYDLTISENALSENGRAALESAETLRFTTVPYPAVADTVPGHGGELDRFQSGVTVYFASPMNVETLEDQVIIEPEPKSATYIPVDNNRVLIINFHVEPRTTYRVTVPQTAADPYGNTLPGDYSWEFSTPPPVPLVSLALPSRVSQLSTVYPTEVQIIHRNVSQIEVDLYEVDDATANLISSDVQSYLPRGRAIGSWSIPVEAEPDEAGVVSLLLADGERLLPGVYYLSARAPELDGDYRWWQNQETFLVVSDSNLVVKEGPESVHVWVTNLEDGVPQAGMPVDLFSRDGVLLGSSATNQDGLVSFPYRPDRNTFGGVLAFSQQPGIQGFGAASSNWNSGVEPWSLGVPIGWNPEPERFAYLYSDRPIYRPGDTVHFRGIVRDTNFGRYPLPSREDISLSLDFISDYEPLVWEWDTTLDENGEFSSEYLIPEDARLGDYRFLFKESEVGGYLDFTVAEYRKPEFQVTVTPADEQLLRNTRTEAAMEAEYFFGGSAADLAVNWSIYQKPFHFPWQGPYYSFGDNARFFYDPDDPFIFDEEFPGEYIAGGEGRTDFEGRFVIDLPADLLEGFGPGSRSVTVSATLFDVTNFPVSSKAEIIFHEAETYVGVSAADYIGFAGNDVEIDLITVDWAGQTTANQDIEVTIYQREWIPTRASDFSRYFTRWEVQDTKIETIQTTTDEFGKSTVSFVPSEGGSYLAVAIVTDEGGRSQTSSSSLWIADSSFAGWRSDPGNRQMDLVADRPDYGPGDTAKILVQSPFEGTATAWLTIERGEVIEQRVFNLNSGSELIDVPITANYAPNIFVTIAVIKGVDASNQYADMRLGITELSVVPEQLQLSLTLTPSQTLLSPGDTAVFDIQVSDHQGNPVEGNFSIALVDLAVLTLKEDNAADIVDALYDEQYLRSQTGSGLFVSGEGMEIEVPLEQLGRGGGGGGGDVESQTAGFLEEDEVRRDFPDTAYWEAQVSTDASGRATVEIPLPDSLTTWRLSSKVVSDFESTGNTLVGQTYEDIVVTKPLLIRPITPRFFTVGDKLQLGAVVHNNTGKEQEVNVRLDATGLTLETSPEQTRVVASGERETVFWPVVVNDEAFADLTFEAKAGQFSDATKPTFGVGPDKQIPINRYSGEDIVGSSGVIDGGGRIVEAMLIPDGVDEREGELSINLSPSIAAGLIEALDYVNNNLDRTTCAHVVADQLLPNAAKVLASQELDLDQQPNAESTEIISKNIAELEQLQLADGGWGWCSADESAPFLSGYVLLALAKAQQAGFEVVPSVIDQAMAYVEKQIVDADTLSDRPSANRQAFFLYVLAETNSVRRELLTNMFVEGRDLLDAYGKGLLLLAMELSGSQGAMTDTLLSDLNNSAVVSASGAHWEDGTADWSNLSSDIRGTAIILDALNRVEPGSALAPAAARWLMAARSAEHWSTGQNTAWSIQALSNWMAVSGELEAEFDYELLVNEDQIIKGDFDETSLDSSANAIVPIKDLYSTETNFIDIRRDDGPGRLYYTAFLDSFIDSEGLAAVDRGIAVERTYYDASCEPVKTVCEPINRIKAGQQVRVELSIILPHDMLYVIVDDPIPSGSEAQDPGLETTAADIESDMARTDDPSPYGYWGWWHFDTVEFRDDRVRFLSEFLPAGTYQYSYILQTNIPGEFQVPPATARQDFFPDVFGRSGGKLFTIAE